ARLLPRFSRDQPGKKPPASRFQRNSPARPARPDQSGRDDSGSDGGREYLRCEHLPDGQAGGQA
ncbi:MAG TPA: hypothetical protein PKA70_18290, partial [Saprospiraceae bacterium]|nr:hypothetical protein [Saprospiraceae bacterium]